MPEMREDPCSMKGRVGARRQEQRGWHREGRADSYYILKQ